MLTDTKYTKDMRNKSIKRIALLYDSSVFGLLLFCLFVPFFFGFFASTEATQQKTNADQKVIQDEKEEI